MEVTCCHLCLILSVKAGHAFESKVERQELQVIWEALDIQRKKIEDNNATEPHESYRE